MHSEIFDNASRMKFGRSKWKGLSFIDVATRVYALEVNNIPFTMGRSMLIYLCTSKILN